MDKRFWSFDRQGDTLKFSISGPIRTVELTEGHIDQMGADIEEIRKYFEDNRDLKTISINIDSWGGSSYLAESIYKILLRHSALKRTHIVRRCGSAATVLALAGSYISMGAQGSFFIHYSAVVAAGTARDLISAGKIIAKSDCEIIRIYQKRTGLPSKKIKQIMNAQTVLNPSEALRLGFIDEIVPDEPGLANSSQNSNSIWDEIHDSRCFKCAYGGYGSRANKNF